MKGWRGLRRGSEENGGLGLSIEFWLFTVTHDMITEPNFIVSGLFLVIHILRLPNRIISGFSSSR